MKKIPYVMFSLFSAMFFQRAIFVLFLLDKGVSNANIGLLQTILLISIIISDYPIGILADKVSRKFTLVLGSGLMVLNAMGMTLVDSMLAFTVLFVLEGIGFAALSNSVESLIYEDSERREYDFSKFISFISLVGSFGLGLSIYIGGIAYDRNSLLPYYITCITSMLALISVLFIKEERAKRNELQSVKSILKSSIDFITNKMPFSIWKMVGVYASIFSVSAPFIIFFQELLFEKGYSTSDIGLIIGSAEIFGALIVVLLSSLLVNRRTDLKVLVVIVLSCTSLLLLDSFFAILTSILIMSTLSVLLWVTLNQDVHDVLDDDIRTSAMSIITSLISLFMAISYWILGLIIGWIGVSFALTLSGFLPLITLVVYSTYGFLRSKESYA